MPFPRAAAVRKDAARTLTFHQEVCTNDHGEHTVVIICLGYYEDLEVILEMQQILQADFPELRPGDMKLRRYAPLHPMNACGVARRQLLLGLEIELPRTKRVPAHYQKARHLRPSL